MTAYVTHFIFILDVVVTFCASIRHVPVADLKEKCPHGVATYKDVLNDNADTSVLDDGQSGWISGYADLSTTLAFEGCFDFSMEQVKRQITIEENNILNDCTTYCKYPNYHFFALKNDKCFCLDVDERSNLNTHLEYVSNCLKMCKGILDSRCDNFVRAYRYTPVTNVSGHGQCLYISKSSYGIDIDSASCRTHEQLTQGFVCEYRARDRCEGQALDFFCREPNPQFPWEEALEKCSEKNGALISLSRSSSFIPLIDCCNKKYWIGGFRVIKPVQDKRDSCLAITRINSSYFLDSGDCRTSKPPVCKLSPTTIKVPIDQTDIPDQSKGENNQVLVTIGVTVGIIVIIVILLCIFFRCFKNRETSHLNKTLINHENDFTNQANSDHVVSDGTQSLPSNEMSNTVRSGKKDTPMKPERNTLRRQKKSIQSYENFQLVPLADSDVKTIKTDTDKGEDEYDHVNLQKLNMKTNNVTDKESEVDVHIYNHMPKHGNEYDVTTVVSSHMNAKNDYSVTETRTLQQLKLQDYTDEDLDNDQYDSVQTDQINKMSKLGQKNEREKDKNHSKKEGILQLNPSQNSKNLDSSNSKGTTDNRMDIDKGRGCIQNGTNNIKENGEKAFLILPKGFPQHPSQATPNSDVHGERVNTLKVLEDDRGDENGEDYYHYIDDEKLTLDYGEEQSDCHEYSDINYGAVGPQPTRPGDYSIDRNRNSDNVYAQVNKAPKFV